jgi:hypothetical protein
MKLFVAAGLFAAFACLSQAQTTGSIPLNAKIYIDPASRFDTYLISAMEKRHVPLTITTQKDAADYQLQALNGGIVIAPPDWSMLWLHGYGEAGIRVINLHNGDAVFFSPLDRNAMLRDWDTAARACAGRLKIAVNRAQSRQRYADPILDF